MIDGLTSVIHYECATASLSLQYKLKSYSLLQSILEEYFEKVFLGTILFCISNTFLRKHFILYFQTTSLPVSTYNVRCGWFTGIEFVLNPTTWVHFLLVRLDSIM